MKVGVLIIGLILYTCRYTYQETKEKYNFPFSKSLKKEKIVNEFFRQFKSLTVEIM